MDRKPGH